MPPHQVQCVLAAGDYIVTASATQLSCFNATGQLLATSSHHKSLVRLLATYVEGTTLYLISTGEDKQLHVSTLPSLELDSSRELMKRANALSVTSDGVIVVGDKFGDVYTYPLHAPAPPAEPKPKGPEEAKAVPILGHVSMLNTLAFVPADVTAGIPRALIITGDRDEHVRVSRFPNGHVIESYLWGSKKFVSALTYLPPTSTSRTPLVLSAGGDATVQCFNLSTGKLESSFPIEDALSPYIVVGPELPTPVPAGKKKNKAAWKLLKGKGKGKGKEESESADGEAAEGTSELEETENDGTNASVTGAGLGTGLAVVKLIPVGSREEGGLLVLASGCTALLYVSYATLLSPSADSTAVSVLDLQHPILDVCPTASTLLTEFWVTLDTTRGAPAAADAVPLRRVTLTSSILQLLEHGELEADICSKAVSSADQLPNVASLYPVLSLLHHPGDIGEGDDEAVDTRQIGGTGRGKGRKELKRPAESSPAREDVVDASGRNGKRAEGRAEQTRRLAAARLKREAEGRTVKTGEETAAEAALAQVDAEMVNAE